MHVMWMSDSAFKCSEAVFFNDDRGISEGGAYTWKSAIWIPQNMIFILETLEGRDVKPDLAKVTSFDMSASGM